MKQQEQGPIMGYSRGYLHQQLKEGRPTTASPYAFHWTSVPVGLGLAGHGLAIG